MTMSFRFWPGSAIARWLPQPHIHMFLNAMSEGWEQHLNIRTYRAAIADLSATLTGSNVEAARSALRGLVGKVSVFAEGKKLYGRTGLNPAQFLRTSNQASLNRLVAGPLRAL